LRSKEAARRISLTMISKNYTVTATFNGSRSDPASAPHDNRSR
jgi:hypothetical protein